MTVGKSHAYFTPEDYLEIERVSPIKHEYLQGQMVAMAGASKAYIIITGNLSALLSINNLWMPQIDRAGDTVEFTSISFALAIETLYENVAQLV